MLVIKFVSQLSLLEFEAYKTNFLKDLRQELNNYSIEIKLIVEENTSINSKPISKLDISKELINKFPLFDKLIKDFDLDIYS